MTDTRRAMTAEGLARLLERLDADRETAAAEYERLRRSLIRFFDWRGASAADELADVTIDRLARRLETETSVGPGVAAPAVGPGVDAPEIGPGVDTPEISNVRQYALGIARLVLLEQRRRPALTPIDPTVDAITAGASSAEPDSDRAACLDRCLGELTADSRALVLQYYDGERAVKITNRRRLAAALGVSDAALRNRVQRLRDRLESCVQRCLAATGMQ